VIIGHILIYDRRIRYWGITIGREEKMKKEKATMTGLNEVNEPIIDKKKNSLKNFLLLTTIY